MANLSVVKPFSAYFLFCIAFWDPAVFHLGCDTLSGGLKPIGAMEVAEWRCLPGPCGNPCDPGPLGLQCCCLRAEARGGVGTKESSQETLKPQASGNRAG
jgi:hypothetical protein